ncbi:zinc finger HIT domain-containing protein 2 [Thalassophryne amazonica]|uniref:zinc finger HIT domain-containing protein 2 n=1 Tax=Thalassophryne amazonica TaxID=390379 RepID=UPI0014721310|nr:zinc finger HIT domain-containing protein 2 [Thalassophryne amazonica]
MDPLIRRRLPPSMRALLTDIAPRQEWTDTDGDTVSRDGILLPSRGSDEFLTPAKTQEEEVAEEGGDTRKGSVCMLCKCKPSSYTCPRCNLPYCSLACYRSPDHSECSEEFYKESVLQALKDMGKTESEGRKKMQDILIGLRQKAERTAGGMETLLRDVGFCPDSSEEEKGEAKERVEVVELLSRLAELQQSEDGNTTEIQGILRKLKEIGECDELLPGELDEEAEGAAEELHLAGRLSGLDLDRLSEEELWELLNSKEKEMFLGLIKGGTLGRLVPLWKPWWEEHEEDGAKALVEVLEEEVCNLENGNATFMDDYKVKTLQEKVTSEHKVKKTKEGNKKHTSKASETVHNVPPVSAKIPKLSSLCSKPSPLVCYGLVNALFSYTFTLGLFNGDTDSLMFEFCDMILALSEALNSNRVFSSVQEALDCGENAVLGGGYLDREDKHASGRATEAVAHIMTGRNRIDATGYCLAALSQLRSVLSKARSAMPKDGEEGTKRQKYFLASKKCEFFQAWVLDNSHHILRLAVELWNEHSKWDRERNSTEKAKAVVEESWKKDKKKGNGCLIEELSC